MTYSYRKQVGELYYIVKPISRYHMSNSQNSDRVFRFEEFQLLQRSQLGKCTCVKILYTAQ